MPASRPKSMFIPAYLSYKDKSAAQQAEQILQCVDELYKRGFQKVGITYSANTEQSKNIKKTYSEDKDYTATTGEERQAEVIKEVEMLLIEKTPYSHLKKVFRILPISTMTEDGKSTTTDVIKNDLADVKHFLGKESYAVLGWQNEDAHNNNYAIGGGAAKNLLSPSDSKIIQSELQKLAQQFRAGIKLNLDERYPTKNGSTQTKKANESELTRSTSSPVTFTHRETIQKVIKVLSPDWAITSIEEKTAIPGTASIHHFVARKDDNEFHIHPEKITTTQKNIATFTAMLKAFFAAYPPEKGILPSIKTPNDEETKQIWQQALNSREFNDFKNIDKIREDFKKKLTPKPAEQKASTPPTSALNSSSSARITVFNPSNNQANAKNYAEAMEKIKKIAEKYTGTDEKYASTDQKAENIRALVDELNSIIQAHQISDQLITYNKHTPKLAFWNMGCRSEKQSLPNPALGKSSNQNKIDCCREIIALLNSKNITTKPLQEAPHDSLKPTPTPSPSSH